MENRQDENDDRDASAGGLGSRRSGIDEKLARGACGFRATRIVGADNGACKIRTGCRIGPGIAAGNGGDVARRRPDRAFACAGAFRARDDRRDSGVGIRGDRHVRGIRQQDHLA